MNLKNRNIGEHIQHVNMSFSREMFATAQINSTIYHNFLSCQPLASSQNMSPTRTGNPIHDPHGIFNFLNKGIFGI